MANESVLLNQLKEEYRILFEEDWPAWVGGLLLAMIVILMFAWERPWGIVEGLRNWGDWFWTSLGVYDKAVPSPFLNNASLMDIGLLFGAFASALFARSFAVRVPPLSELVKGFVAGILMGVGSALARGCNVGGFYTSLSALSLSGFAMMIGLLLGTYVGLRYLLWELDRFPPRVTRPAGERTEKGGFDARAIQPWIGLAVLVAGVLVSFQYAASAYTKIGGLLLMGLAIGMVMHRSRLCFVAAFRDPFMTGDSRQSRAIALSTMVAVVGYAVIKWAGLREEMVYVTPTFLFGGIAGGIVFGIGMVIAGGCGSGTLWRVAEGQVKLWMVMVSFALTNALVRYHMDTTGLIQKMGRAVYLPHLLTYKWSVLALLALMILWYLAAAWNEETQKFTVEM